MLKEIWLRLSEYELIASTAGNAMNDNNAADVNAIRRLKLAQQAKRASQTKLVFICALMTIILCIVTQFRVDVSCCPK